MRMESKDTYRIQYVDNSYQIVEWTEEQLDDVYRDMASGEEVSLLNKCIFRLKDIRTITFLPPVEEELDDNPEEPETVMVTEEGVYDKEVYDILQSMGMLSDVGQERRKR